MIKFGWYETIKDTVCYHDSPLNVAVIVDQLSRHNNMLREMISEEKMVDVKLSATAKDYVPMDNTNMDNDGKAIEEKKAENWMHPKYVPIDYFCVKYKNVEGKKERRNNNRCELLQCDDDDDMNEE